jgi:hypothetical protein
MVGVAMLGDSSEQLLEPSWSRADRRVERRSDPAVLALGHRRGNDDEPAHGLALADVAAVQIEVRAMAAGVRRHQNMDATATRTGDRSLGEGQPALRGPGPQGIEVLDFDIEGVESLATDDPDVGSGIGSPAPGDQLRVRCGVFLPTGIERPLAARSDREHPPAE